MKSKLSKIISRIIADESFRNDFLADAIKATEKYSLTEEEAAELKAIDIAELTSMSSTLEERISKSFVNLPDIPTEGDDFDGDMEKSYSRTSSGHSSDGW